MEKLLKLKEAAEILSVHPNTLRLWDRKGILVAVRIGEKKIRRYRLEDIKKFILCASKFLLIKRQGK